MAQASLSCHCGAIHLLAAHRGAVQRKRRFKNQQHRRMVGAVYMFQITL
jgi:hypothetical protein